MSGRFVRFATTVALGSSLALSGCTGGGPDVAGGLLPAGQSEPLNARPPREGHLARLSAGAPPVELPAGFALTVEAVDVPADSPERAVLDDTAMLFAALYQAIGRGDPDDPLYARYAGSDVRAALREVIAVFVANGWTVTGEARVTRRHVELTTDETTATVSWCADLRTVFPTEIASGHVLESAAGDHSFLHYSGAVALSPSGVWVADELESIRAAPACVAP